MNSKEYKKKSTLIRSLLRFKRLVPLSLVNIIDAKWFKKEKIKIAGDGSRGLKFIIIGCGRSGNTLVKRELVSHYNVVIPPEIPGMGRLIRFYYANRHLEWPYFVEGFVERFKKDSDIDVKQKEHTYNLYRELGVKASDLKEKLLELDANSQTLADAINSIYELYKQKHDVPSEFIIGDKTPWNIFYLENILKVFPDIKIIHMVRDPRAVALSYEKSLRDITGVNYRDGIIRWRDSVYVLNRTLDKIKSPERFIEIRYEDFVLNPEEKLNELSIFLGLSKDLNDFGIMGADEILNHHGNLKKPITKSSLYAWKEELNQHDLDFAYKKVGNMMEKYGYSRI